MKLRGGTIHDFGLFHDAILPELGDLVLFLGDNEAGKSTLLAFFRQIFFGLARGRDTDYLPPLSGARRAGQLRLVTAAGEELILERHEEEKDARLRDAAGREMDPEVFRRLLSGATPEAFNQLFAFSLNELQSMDGIRGADLTTALYGLTLGTSVQALPHARSELAARLEALFKNRGQKPLINELARRYETVHGQLVDARREMDHYENNVATQAELATAISDLKKRRLALRTELARLERIQSGWTTWQEWLSLAPPAEAAAETKSYSAHQPEVADLRRDLAHFAAERDKAADSVREFEERIARLQPDEKILQQRLPIIELRNGLERHEERLRRLTELRAESAELDQQAARARQHLGQQWTSERIEAVDLGLFTRQKIREFDKQQRQLGARLEAAEKYRQSLTHNVRELEEENRGLIRQQENFAPPPQPADPDIRSWLQRERPRMVDAAADLPRLEERCRAAEAEFHHYLRNLQTDWTAGDLAAFDTGTAARNRVVTLKQQLDSARQSRQQAEMARDETTRRLAEKEESLQRIEAGLHSLESSPDREALQTRQGELRILRNKLSDHRHRDERVRQLAERENDLRQLLAASPNGTTARAGRLLVVIAVTLLAAAPVAALLLLWWQQPAAGYLLGGSLLALALLLLIIRHRLVRSGPAVPPDMDRRLGELRTAAAAAESARAESLAAISDLAGKLRLASAEIHPERLDELELELEGMRNGMEERRRLELEQRQEFERLQDLQKTLAGREEEVARATAGETRVWECWQAWARENRLPEAVTPEVALELISRAETARLKQSEWHRGLEQQRALEHRLDECRQRAADAGLPELAAAESPLDMVRIADVILARYETEQELLDRHAALANERKKAEQVLAAAQARLEEQQNIVDGYTADAEQAQAEWQAWLEKQGLDPHLDPVTATEALERIREFRDIQRQGHDLSRQAEEIRQEVVVYEEKAAAVFAALAEPGGDPHRLAAEVELLTGRLDKAKNARDERDNLLAQKGVEAARYERFNRDHADRQERLHQLLAGLGCHTADEFAKRAAEEERQRENARQREMRLQKLKAITGLEEESQIRERFETTEPDRLAAEISELRQEEKELEEQLEAKRQEMYRLEKPPAG